MANYLYNGVELPDIESVYTDEVKAERPFVTLCIATDYDGTEFPVLFASKVQLVSNEDGVIAPYNQTGTGYIQFVCPDGEWFRQLNSIQISGSAFWANYDIYKEDGTLYLAASDPIPVGSAPEVEPKAFMAGSWMGQVVKYYGIGI